MLKSDDLIKQFNLTEHPEGGYFKESYRSELNIKAQGFSAQRSCSTAIYFLLKAGQFSAFHRIKSDELWHFYTGEPLEIIEISITGQLIITQLGHITENKYEFQHLVKAGNWFAARPLADSKFSFVGCTVAPGFDFNDFEMATNQMLSTKYPQHKNIISELTYR